MDTLSSTIKVPFLHPTHRELYHLKTPNTSNNHHHQLHPHHNPHLSSATKPRTSFALDHRNLNFPLLTPSSSSLKPPSPTHTHRKPATGYAAALLDKAISNSSLEMVQKDVQRLSKLLNNERIQAFLIDPFMGVKEKGQIVKEVIKLGKVNRYLWSVLKMLIERNKVGIVSEVLEEFERIYDELIGTKVVYVSSVKKMEEDELFVIANRVQKLSGAMKVKVRNFVDHDRLSSFAV